VGGGTRATTDGSRRAGARHCCRPPPLWEGAWGGARGEGERGERELRPRGGLV
jgi:hypothetical protein